MRSFIAINLPDVVKREIDTITGQLRPAGPPARWVPGANLHLTLKFLDEIMPEQVLPIRGAIQMVCRDIAPLSMRLGGFGVFPNAKRARIFWVAITEGFETLKKLAHEIDLAVSPLGFPPEEREFSAHITLARFRETGPVDRLLKAASRMPYKSKAIPIERVDLMKSVLSPKSAEYSILESVRMTAPMP